jgi:hypothetical protein
MPPDSMNVKPGACASEGFQPRTVSSLTSSPAALQGVFSDPTGYTSATWGRPVTGAGPW